MSDLNPFSINIVTQNNNPNEEIVINEEQDKKSIYALAQKYIKDQEKKKKAPDYTKVVFDTIKCIEYYCDPLGEYHGVVNINGVTHVFNIDSEKFQSYLNKTVYDKHGIALDPKKLRTCLGIALFDIMESAKPAKFIRRIAHTDNALYINRGLRLPSFIKVDLETCQRGYLSAAPFIPKIKVMEDTALDYKKNDGSCLKKFFEILKIDDKLDQLLITTYAVSKMFPDRRGVLLHIIGKQGTGKTTLAWAIKNLVDPGDIDTLPSKKDELVQLFDHNAVPVIDNIGTLTKEFSNTLCTMVTGITLRKRAHFTNDEDFVYQVINNGILTSIKLPILAHDLISRTFFLEKKSFKNNCFTQDKNIRNELTRIQPYCFDEIIDLTLAVRKESIDYRIYGNNRNMDFIAIGKIVSNILYNNESFFDEVVQRNIQYTINESINISQEAAAMIEFMLDKQEYVSTPSKIIADLDAFGCVNNQYNRHPVHFSRRLYLATDLLREKGIDLVDNNTHGSNGKILKFINYNFIDHNGEVMDAPISESEYTSEIVYTDEHIAADCRHIEELLGPMPDSAVEEEYETDDDDNESELDEEQKSLNAFINFGKKYDPDFEYDPYTGEWK